MPDVKLVDPATDARVVDTLSAASRIGIDTEFMREKTYFAELALVQVATGMKPDGEVLCIDPLTLRDQPGYREFWHAAMRPAWVLHSGRQDIEVIFQSAACMPGEVFDTQVAAGLLGMQPQIGYANLVAELFDVELAKSHTRADWLKRPLSQSVLNYAAEDVEYLLPAYEELVSRLEKLGRRDWAVEDSALLLDESLYVVEPDSAIFRVKGAGKLRGAARAAATALADWREREALDRNRPRQWILRDPVLIELAVRRPQDVASLKEIDGLQDRTVQRLGRTLLAVLESAGQHDPFQPPLRPDESQKRLMKQAQKRIAKLADELGIAAEIIAPKKELSAAMQGERELRLFRGWRRGLVGEELLALFDDA